MEKGKTSQADVEALQLEQVGCFEGTEGRTLNFDVGLSSIHLQML